MDMRAYLALAARIGPQAEDSVGGGYTVGNPRPAEALALPTYPIKVRVRVSEVGVQGQLRNATITVRWDGFIAYDLATILTSGAPLGDVVDVTIQDSTWPANGGTIVVEATSPGFLPSRATCINRGLSEGVRVYEAEVSLTRSDEDERERNRLLDGIIPNG